MKNKFLLMLQYFEAGESIKVARTFNTLGSVERIKLVTDCFEKNIFNTNASTRIKIMSLIFKINA